MNRAISWLLSTLIVFSSSSFFNASDGDCSLEDIENSAKVSKVVPTGCNNNIYEIKNGWQLLWVASKINSGDTFENKIIVLKTDIDLSLPSKSWFSSKKGPGKLAQWEPIGNYESNKKKCSFKGEFNGNNKKIQNLVMDYDMDNYIGLFGYIEVGAYIHDVELSSDCYIKGKNHVAGIVAYNRGGKIFNCINKATVIGGNNVGGIAGDNHGIISECQNKGKIMSTKNSCGGISGTNINGRILDCYNKGSVSGATNVAGIAGINDGTMDSCYSNADICGDYFVAGLSAINKGNIVDCYNKGSIAGDRYVGGLIGRNFSNISISYNLACVKGDRYVGGLVGTQDGAIENCFNKGDISGDYYVGGLAGIQGDGSIGNCYSSGNVFGDYYIGGLVGDNGGKITNTYTRGSVEGEYYYGAISGRNSGKIRDSYWNSSIAKIDGIGLDSGDSKDITGYTSEFMRSLDFSKILNSNSNEYNYTQPRTVAHYWSRTDKEGYPIL